jgi:UDP-3-O-[3-hydroxymyristoyl] glucosamine N-acyltransferase
MPDRRFFRHDGPVSLVDLARLAGAEFGRPVEGDVEILNARPLARADSTSVSFFSDRRYLQDLKRTLAGAVFVEPRLIDSVPPTAVPLVSREPQAAWARAAARLHPPHLLGPGPAIADTVVLEAGVVLAPGVVLGDGVTLGAGTVVGANTVIGPGVTVGRGCLIGANVTLGFALIGDGVRIAAGAVIGEAGFGLAASRLGALDVSQLGRVIIQDRVSLGANTTIDRGAFEDTIVGEGCKIDNLVQIGHNVILGRGCVVTAQVGFSGSVKVGDGVRFGGQAGMADHITIGAGAQIAAGAGVIGDVPAGQTYSGYPARPIRRWLREAAWVARQARKPKAGEEE